MEEICVEAITVFGVDAGKRSLVLDLDDVDLGLGDGDGVVVRCEGHCRHNAQ